MTGFDTEKYSKLIDEFLLNIQQINSMNFSDTQKTSEDMCDFLRIGKIEIIFFSNKDDEKANNSRSFIFFQKDNYDEKRFYFQKEVTASGNIMYYKIYQKKDTPDWSETENNKIKVVQKIIFSFVSRTRIVTLLENLSFKDQELGIYNSRYFLKFAESKFENNDILRYGACYFNLRHFSNINHQFGRKKGTEIIKGFVDGLIAKLSNDEVVCRIGGDNFCCLFFKENLNLIMQYMKGVGVIYDEKAGNRILVSASAGYYIIDSECSSANDIMDYISIAINIARNVMNTDYIFFDNELMRSINSSRHIEQLFYNAIETEEFQVYYQPKVNLRNYQLAGAEALCRWFHDGKLFPPDSFIPILERAKAICVLDFYMLEHTCRDIRRWLDDGREVVTVSVNFSRRNLGNMDFLKNVIAVIDKYNVPHKYIEVELTETAVDLNSKELKDVVFGLQENGISTSVDDFGVGYSSLSLIRELPWNVLKIDKSFLPMGSNISDPNRHSMLKHVVAMAQEIGLECIVEGIETIEQVKLLKENHCYLAQGFYFDRPLQVDEFEKRLKLKATS